MKLIHTDDASTATANVVQNCFGHFGSDTKALHARRYRPADVMPAPRRRFAQHEEGGDLVERIVHPARLEGGAVAAFVPARV